jgi:hypothetical protein
MSLMTDSVNFIARADEKSFMVAISPDCFLGFFLRWTLKNFRGDYMGRRRVAVNIKFATEFQWRVSSIFLSSQRECPLAG